MAERHRPLTVREIETLRQMIDDYDYSHRRSSERTGFIRNSRELLLATVAIAQIIEIAAFLWHSGTHQGIGLITAPGMWWMYKHAVDRGTRPALIELDETLED